jgi:hypothetical protein
MTTVAARQHCTAAACWPALPPRRPYGRLHVLLLACFAACLLLRAALAVARVLLGVAPAAGACTRTDAENLLGFFAKIFTIYIKNLGCDPGHSLGGPYLISAPGRVVPCPKLRHDGRPDTWYEAKHEFQIRKLTFKWLFYAPSDFISPQKI